MMQYIFSPRWFYGIDIAFEIFSMLITILIARYGYKLYRASGNKKHRYFSLFFLLMGAAFLAKIFANFDIYYMNVSSIRIANTVFYFETSRVSEILFTIGFSIFRFLMMLSFFGLLYITRKREPGLFYLCIYFIAIIAIFSYSEYYIFHLTMVVILSMLFSFYYRNYKKKGIAKRESLLTAISFFLLLLSQAAFTAIGIDMIMYVAGEILQLMGYSALLYEYILVTRYEE